MLSERRISPRPSVRHPRGFALGLPGAAAARHPLPSAAAGILRDNFGCSLEPIPAPCGRTQPRSWVRRRYTLAGTSCCARNRATGTPRRRGTWTRPRDRALSAAAGCGRLGAGRGGGAPPHDPLEREADRAAAGHPGGAAPVGPLSRESRALVRRQVSIGSAAIHATHQPAGSRAGPWHNDETHEERMGFSTDDHGIVLLGFADLQGGNRSANWSSK